MSNEEILAALRERLGTDQAVLDYLTRVAAGEEQRCDLPRVKVLEEVTLAKFDGEFAEGKEPVEVIRIMGDNRQWLLQTQAGTTSRPPS